MKVPFSWLKQYVDIDVSAQELETKLFDCGFEVEELIDLGAEISKVVVGVVTECVPQEGTHLHICKVDCGDYGHDIQISTGASNVYAGMHTPAALDLSLIHISEPMCTPVCTPPLLWTAPRCPEASRSRQNP